MGNITSDILQLSLFESPDARQANYTALFDLAPRYMQRSSRNKGSAYLDGVSREFSFNGEKYGLTITPARIKDASGAERDELPGEREQLVEDVIRKLASNRVRLGEQNEVLTTFSVYSICNELSRHKHTFSKTEVKEALQVLHRSIIEITKVNEDGGKKKKAIVSASVFPALYLKDDNDPNAQSYVQLNPFLADAIKSLAFDQVDYEWMMQIKGQMTRWVFKNISLTLAATDTEAELMEIKASDIAMNYGSQWSRWRDMLAQVHKSIQQLVKVDMITDFESTDIMDGKKKADVKYVLRLSEKFMEDRRAARAKSRYISEQSERAAGNAQPNQWHKISNEKAAGLRFGAKEITSDIQASRIAAT